jgi:AcrR family transcriptional regulator
MTTAAATADEQAPRRVRMSRAQRREHFLDVAAELVVEGGLDAVTMERVAARAGVSKALGYAYFDNSDALLAALFDREMAAYDRSIVAVVESSGTFQERIRGVIGAMFDMVADRGRLYGRLLYGDSPPGSTLGDRQGGRKRSAQAYIGKLIADEYGIPAEEARTLAAMWIAANLGAIESWVDGRASRRQITDLFVAMTIGGLEHVARRPTAVPGTGSAAPT